jgi:hypothetical protein
MKTKEREGKSSGILHQLFIDFKKASNTVARKMLCNILTKLSIPIKLLRLIKTFITVNILSDKFYIYSGL